MDIDLNSLIANALGDAIIARAKCEALAEFLIPDNQKEAYKKCVKEKVKANIVALKNSPNSEFFEKILKQLDQQE